MARAAAHTTADTHAASPASLSPSPSGEAVCAVMVTHHPGPSLPEILAPLLAQVERLVIVDNCSGDETRDIIHTYQAQEPGRIELLLRESNNLAAAQNDGIRRALELGYSWVLLMDHDSVPAAGMVETLRRTAHALPHGKPVGIAAPRLTDIHSGRQARYPQLVGRLGCRRVGFGDQPLLDGLLGVIASGSLVPASVFRQVGWMDERLCIDYVDKEFCLRVVRGGYRIVAVRDAVLHHQLGRSKDHRLMGLRVTTTNHSPERCYYIYRNRIASWGKHGLAVPAFVAYDLLAIGYDLLRLLCFEQQKTSKLKAIWRGTRDALRGVSGPADALEPR